ncbi:hypothetical protein ACLOJK_035567 [Asimina triloba]
MSSHHGSSANDPRQPSSARPYVPPTVAPQDLPVDYAGFIAIVFGVTGVMFRMIYGRIDQKAPSFPSSYSSLVVDWAVDLGLDFDGFQVCSLVLVWALLVYPSSR